MPKAELGQKHECSECGARFYDLGRETAACPKCDAISVMPIGAIPERRRRRRGEKIADAKKEIEKQKVEAEAEAEEEEEEDPEVEELDLDDAQAERHLSETIGSDDDDEEDAESELNEVSEFADAELPDEVEVVGGDEDGSDDAADADDAEDDDDEFDLRKSWSIFQYRPPSSAYGSKLPTLISAAAAMYSTTSGICGSCSLKIINIWSSNGFRVS